jgi:hypothetical protein
VRATGDDVNLDMVKRVNNPTTLAFVSFATGEPQYAFFYNDAAGEVYL